MDRGRQTLRGADFSARGRSGRQPLHHRPRPRALYVGAVRRRRAPRRKATPRPGHAGLDVDSASSPIPVPPPGSASASVSIPLDGHRTIGHGGAIYGFATSLEALPDDSLGVVVVATLDVINAVTDAIADAALRMLLATRAGKPLPTVPTPAPLTRSQAIALMGRYMKGDSGVDLEEYDGRLYLTPVQGGMRSELRAGDSSLVLADQPSQDVRIVPPGRIAVGKDTLKRLATPDPRTWPWPSPSRRRPPIEFAGLIGEYGWDHDVLYIREKDGKLNALIEWFFEYPLRRVSRDVYRFPDWGLYQSEQIVFRRDSSGRATVAIAGSVPFKRSALAGDDDRVSFRITPVKPVADLRTEALAASPTRGDRRLPAHRSGRAPESRLHHRLRHPLRDAQQLHGRAVLHLGPRLHAAAGGGGGRSRCPAAPAAGLRAAGARFLSAVVRDQDVLGRHAGGQALFVADPAAWVAPQPRLRGRHHPLRSEERASRFG